MFGVSRRVTRSLHRGIPTEQHRRTSSRDVFSPSCGESVGVIVHRLDIDAPFAETDAARAAWEHWGSSSKPPRQQSIVLVSRRGSVTHFRIGHLPAATAPQPRDRLIQIRERLACVLEQSIAIDFRR
ncbi:MAG TPA: hypothetical protein VGR59_12185 [Gemmatimonadaceae bacterium]|nr:hypothetical protein [Gemmatimonadaceae bacterium]